MFMFPTERFNRQFNTEIKKENFHHPIMHIYVVQICVNEFKTHLCLIENMNANANYLYIFVH